MSNAKYPIRAPFAIRHSAFGIDSLCLSLGAGGAAGGSAAEAAALDRGELAALKRGGPAGAGKGAGVVHLAAVLYQSAVVRAAVDGAVEPVAHHVAHHHRHEEAARTTPRLARLAVAGAELGLALLLLIETGRLGRP